MLRLFLAGVSIWFTLCGMTQAVTVNATFTGSANVLTSVFGLSGFGLPVTGSFYYDTTVPPSVSSLPCSGAACSNYEQETTGGFTATIGSVTVSADNYIVQVKNDFDNLGTNRDSLVVVWNSGLTPALSPLKVNGSDQLTGQFRIDLTAVDTLFSDASLPTSLNWSNFSALSPPGLLGNSTSIPNIFISLSSLTAIQTQSQDFPLSISEPSGGSLLLAGLFFLLPRKRRNHHHVVLCNALSKVV